MNTERLIEMLSVNPEPVDGRQPGKLLLPAIVASGAAAFVLMVATVGPRPDLQSPAHLEWVAIKLLFALSVIAAGVPLLNRSIRPGLEDQTNWGLIFLPFLGAQAIAVAVLLLAHAQARETMLIGATTVSSARCLGCIVFFAAIPLAAVILALRRGAPTRLRLCGAIAGVVAGGLGALAYAFNCASDAIPFVAIWYTAAIALCAFVGALLGPRVLRW